MASVILYVLLSLLMIDCLVEVGFIGSTVGYLHNGGIFNVFTPNGSTLQLFAKPLHLSVNQGHMSNGAAGTALILVGLLGLLVISSRSWLERKFPRYVKPLHTIWLVFTILSFLLTVGALAYVFTLKDKTDGQSINLDRPGITNPGAYPYNTWTPQAWYSAALDLPFLNESDKDDIRKHLHIMIGWQWNLLVLFLLESAVLVFVILEWLRVRSGKGEDSRIYKKNKEVEEVV